MNRISERIRYVGVNDYSKKLFEGLWPLPYGVSYNSYLVVDEKVALVDTVGDGFEVEFIDNIKSEIGNRRIDYLIVNHMEPDHSALISIIRELYPGIMIVADAKAVPMLKGYHSIAEDEILVVRDGDSLSLGSCSLDFHLTPMVHWPETMMTWCAKEQTLFSGDGFGSFGALEHGITDRQIASAARSDDGFKDTFSMYKDEMMRYYADIVGKYGLPVQGALKKLAGLPIGRICSTHGPVWEEQIEEVIGIYDRMSRYEAEKGVCIVYASMYGNTAKAAHSLARELAARKVPFAIHDLAGYDGISAALGDVFKYETIAVGSPTYNGSIFPPVETFMRALQQRQVKFRKFFCFGSYTWASASIRLLTEMAEGLGYEILAPGKPFPQAFSTEKCNMAAVAELMKLD